MTALSVSEQQSYQSLRTYLLSLPLAGSPEVVQGQANRVAEPATPDFVVMTATIRSRLEWNVDSLFDVAYTGSAAGGTLTVTAVQLGTLVAGATVFGTGLLLAGGTFTLGAQLGGSAGGTGTYALSPSATIPSQQLASGAKALLQPTRLTVQCDVHGPNAGDNAQIVSTALRDAYAVDAFNSYGPDVWPLYADDPRQVAFIDGEQQFEERWTVDVQLQVNPALTLPQQFFTSVVVGLHEIGSGPNPAPS